MYIYIYMVNCCGLGFVVWVSVLILVIALGWSLCWRGVGSRDEVWVEAISLWSFCLGDLMWALGRLGFGDALCLLDGWKGSSARWVEKWCERMQGV